MMLSISQIWPSDQHSTILFSSFWFLCELNCDAEHSEIKSDEQVWNFFCKPDYKYANSKRANRITVNGYWKITGKPIEVKDKFGKVIGCKKTLVYHRCVDVASKMVKKTDWVMNEFSVEDSFRYKVFLMNLCIELKSSSAGFHLYIPCSYFNGYKIFDSTTSLFFSLLGFADGFCFLLHSKKSK